MAMEVPSMDADGDDASEEDDLDVADWDDPSEDDDLDLTMLVMNQRPQR
jgi:hypothetical protein